MAQQSWVALANDVPPIVAITSNTFTGPQDLTTGTAGTLGIPLTVPANFFRVGQAWRFTAGGSFSTTGTPTLVFGIYVGAAAQAVNVALTTASGAATLPWWLTVQGTIRSIGASTSGTMMCQGLLTYGTTLTAVTTIPIPGIALAVGTGFDTTIANKLTVDATYSSSSSSNIVVLHQWLVEYMN
jgi:hypothetical protein